VDSDLELIDLHYVTMEQKPSTEKDTYSPRGVLLALGVLLLLVLGGLYLFYALRDESQRQDCMMQGRSNCAPETATTP
jgi:hypothetical protein